MLIQLGALVLLLFLLWFTNQFFAFTMPLYGFLVIQSLLTVVLSSYVGMQIWWRYLHFIFPLAIYGMLMLQLPGQFYLIGFLLSLSLYWTTFRTQVPFYPSRPAVWRQVSELMPKSAHLRVVDIGSGLGDMTMYLARHHQDGDFLGIEIAPLPWLISFLRAKLHRSRAKFIIGDYNTLDFSQFDMVFAYLSPAAMPALWEKAKSEMRSGSLLISYEFNIDQAPSPIDISMRGDLPLLYVWKM